MGGSTASPVYWRMSTVTQLNNNTVTNFFVYFVTQMIINPFTSDGIHIRNWNYQFNKQVLGPYSL
jgi:hypothetical protein